MEKFPVKKKKKKTQQFFAFVGDFTSRYIYHKQEKKD